MFIVKECLTWAWSWAWFRKALWTRGQRYRNTN